MQLGNRHFCWSGLGCVANVRLGANGQRCGGLTNGRRRSTVSGSATASRCAPSDLEPLLDIFDPKANVPADLYPLRCLAAASPAIDGRKRNLEEPSKLVGTEQTVGRYRAEITLGVGLL